MVDQIPLRDRARSLGPLQVGGTVVRLREAIGVQAWTATRRGEVLVSGQAVAWTPRAVRVHYFDEHGREGYAWVWASAVARR